MNISLERQPTSKATLEVIDEGAVQSFIQKALRKQRILESAANLNTYTILKNLELVNEQGVLLLAAVLLFGKTHNGTQRRLVIKSGALESPTATLNTKIRAIKTNCTGSGKSKKYKQIFVY